MICLLPNLRMFELLDADCLHDSLLPTGKVLSVSIL